MKAKLLFSYIILLTGLLAFTACSYVSHEEYDRLAIDLAHLQEELDDARDVISQLQESLTEAEAELQTAETELLYYVTNPPIIEVDFIDIGEIARLTSLKASKGVIENSTYIIECKLKLSAELTGLVNVVDVELYVDDAFNCSERWIDISSSGFVTTKQFINFDTGLEQFDKPIQIRIIPSFKVFGA